MTQRIALSWSGGKDSLMALLSLEANPDYRIGALVTALGEEERRISMHGIPEALLVAQSEALRIPLVEVTLPTLCDNETYRARMKTALSILSAEGISAVAFGDLFLEDIRAFRETQMRALDLQPLFPLWGTATQALAGAFVASGHRAIVTCVDATQLDEKFLGREFDESFLADLPLGVDPCGERGEFHSFVFSGPRLAAPLAFCPGRRAVSHGRFHFLDLVPGEPAVVPV